VNGDDTIAVHHIKPIGIVSGAPIQDHLTLIVPLQAKKCNEHYRNR
jgi:hypothetical protein